MHGKDNQNSILKRAPVHEIITGGGGNCPYLYIDTVKS